MTTSSDSISGPVNDTATHRKPTEIAKGAGRLSCRDRSSKSASSSATAKAVKDAFTRCWSAYKSRAWMADEVTPLSGTTRNGFGGWGATLVDSLDAL